MVYEDTSQLIRPTLNNVNDKDGASDEELVIAAIRSNLPDLLNEIVEKQQQPLKLLNSLTTPLGAKPIHIACQYGSVEALDYLIDIEGVNLNASRDTDGDTPLHVILKSRLSDEKRYIMCDLLLDAGANINVRNKEGLLPEMLVRSDELNLKRLFQEARFSAIERKSKLGDNSEAEDDDMEETD